MNVTDEVEQTARNIAVARSIDVDDTSGIAPRDTDEVKSKSEGGREWEEYQVLTWQKTVEAEVLGRWWNNRNCSKKQEGTCGSQ